MNNKRSGILIGTFSFLAALAVSQPAAIAQTVTLELMSPPGSPSNNGNAAGVFLSPYYFSINGSSSVTPLICDDFTDDITQFEKWTATVYSNGSSPTVNFGGLATTGGIPNATEYEEIGYLASLLLTPPTPSTGAPSTVGGPDQTALSFALWAVLDPALNPNITGNNLASYNLGSTEDNSIHGALAAAANAAATNGAYYLNGLTIYQPVPNSQSTGGTPQQFVGFNVPEALSTVTLTFNLLALFTAVFLFRRRNLKNTEVAR